MLFARQPLQTSDTQFHFSSVTRGIECGYIRLRYVSSERRHFPQLRLYRKCKASQKSLIKHPDLG